MAAVVRARCHFIDDEAALHAAIVNDEKLNAQHAHITDVLRYCFGSIQRPQSMRLGHISFISVGHRQNAVHMHIALRQKAHHVAIPAARHQHRALGFERHQLFQHARHAFQISPGSCQLGGIFNPHLAFAVVAHARGF